MDVTGKTKIYRKDFDGKPRYSRAISSQEYKDGQKGDWITVYESVQFPKGTVLADRSVIEVTKGFEATYKSKDGNKRKLVVQEYKVLDGKVLDGEAQEGFTALSDEDIPF